MYFGADYYPEHWPRERWPIDARMMREAGINTVRVADFAWALIEPIDGVYDFSLFDAAIEVLASEGIKVIVCTPTAATPKWLGDKHPEIYLRNERGEVRGFGSRYHHCFNSPIMHQYSQRLAAAMAKHYGNNPQIIAWQIDNEYANSNTARCYCENCRQAFIAWLQQKYGSIETVNKAWGTVFWSQTYTNWDQIILPGAAALNYPPLTRMQKSLGHVDNVGYHNPGLMLDFSRFASDSVKKYQKIQIDEIKKYSAAPVMHDFCLELSLDWFSIGAELDIAGFNWYTDLGFAKIPFQAMSMFLSMARSIKNKNFWVIEQQSGPAGWETLGNTPDPGKIRLWTYQSLAHGAEAIVYFRWRACTVGTEQYWYGILDHDGLPRRRYREIQEIGRELPKISGLITGSEKQAQAAVIMSFDNHWCHEIQWHNAQFSYLALLAGYYSSFIANSISTDVCGIEANLATYKLIVMPAFNLMREDIANKLHAYVEQGGNLVVTFRSGTREWDNTMTTKTLPGYFRELAGIELEEFDSLNAGPKIDLQTLQAENRKVRVKGIAMNTRLSTLAADLKLHVAKLLPFTGKASMWCDIIKPLTATVKAIYGSEFYAGKAAITCNIVGAGRVYYVGCDLDIVTLITFMRGVIRETGVRPVTDQLLEDVEIVSKKSAAGENFVIAMNQSGSRKRVKLGRRYIDALTGKATGKKITLKPFGVGVLIER